MKGFINQINIIVEIFMERDIAHIFRVHWGWQWAVYSVGTPSTVAVFSAFGTLGDIRGPLNSLSAARDAKPSHFKE